MLAKASIDELYKKFADDEIDIKELQMLLAAREAIIAEWRAAKENGEFTARKKEPGSNDNNSDDEAEEEVEEKHNQANKRPGFSQTREQ